MTLHNTELALIEIKSRSIEAKALLIKTKIRVLEAEINSAFKINITGIEQDINRIEKTAKDIIIEISSIENKIKFILETTMLKDWKMKALENRIGVIERGIKRSTANVLIVNAKIKNISKKVATASPQQPFIKHYRFSVTR